MMHKNVGYSLVLVYALIGVFCFAPWIPWVEATGTIYIRSDGLVFPTNAPIQREGYVYTLTDNINDSIVIKRNDTVLDGGGIYTLTGPGDYDSTGIEVTERHNVTIQNFQGIEAFGYGILVNRSSNTLIRGNTVTSNNRGGIHLSEAQNSSIYGNHMTLNNNYDIKLYHSSHNELAENQARRVLLEYSSNNNSIHHNQILVSGQEGIGLGWSANHNKIYGNHIKGGLYGIHAFYASSQRVWGNDISDTRYGLDFQDSSNNVIIGNTVKNTTTAIYLDSSSENTIFHNNFLEFEKDAFVFDSHLNLWDLGYPTGGNYWSNYTGVDLDHDGIGDSPHLLDTENSDNYPLMGTFSGFAATGELDVQTICNSTVTAFHFNGTAINFSVAGETGTTGFCRILIPKALIADGYRVFVNSTEILPAPEPLSFSNSTHIYLYFAYSHSEQDVVIIPESPSLLLPLLLIVASITTLAYSKQRKS